MRRAPHLVATCFRHRGAPGAQRVAASPPQRGRDSASAAQGGGVHRSWRSSWRHRRRSTASCRRITSPCRRGWRSRPIRRVERAPPPPPKEEVGSGRGWCRRARQPVAALGRHRASAQVGKCVLEWALGAQTLTSIGTPPDLDRDPRLAPGLGRKHRWKPADSTGVVYPDAPEISWLGTRIAQWKR